MHRHEKDNTHAATVSQACNHGAGQLLTSGLICVHVTAASCLEQKSCPPHRDAYRISPTGEAALALMQTQIAYVEKLKV